MPDEKKSKGKGGATPDNGSEASDEPVVISKPRPDVTQRGCDMIGDFRTDALHEALGRAPIEDDTLMALLILAFAGLNVRVDSGAGGAMSGGTRFKRHAAMLFDGEGKFVFDMDTLRVAARSTLIDVLSCRRGISNSGVLSLVAGDAIGADGFLPNMGTVDFLECLSRQALEASCGGTPVLPRQRVRETRAALVEHFKEGHFVHPAARFTPELPDLADILKARDAGREEDDSQDADGGAVDPEHQPDDGGSDGQLGPDSDPVADDQAGSDEPSDDDTAYGVAAE
jgi:ParB family chromosome partitioning protein